MLSSTKTNKSGKLSKTRALSLKTRHQLIGTGYIVFGVLCAVVGYLIIFGVNTTSSNQAASLYVKPSAQRVSAGKTVTLEVWVDTKNQPINAVQTNLSYPTDKFELKNIDSTGSAFEVEAQSTAKNGVIKIARGHIGSVKGKQLVTKVNLVARSNSGRATVSFTNGTAVVRSTDNMDILGNTTVEHFTLAALSPPNTTASLYKP